MKVSTSYLPTTTTWRNREPFRGIFIAATMLGVLLLVSGKSGAQKLAASARSSTAAKASKAPLTELIEAARGEKKLTMLQGGTYGAAEFWEELEAAMNAKYGIKVDLQGTAGGPNMSQVTSRLLQEHKQGRTPASTDIMIASGRNQLALAKAGALMEVDWRKYMPELKDEEIATNRSGILAGVGLIAAAYNTNVIKSEDVPKSLEEVTRPKYKGLITATTYGSGWPEIALNLGPKKVEKILETIATNGNLAGNINGDLQRIASGEFGLYLFTGNLVEVEKFKARGAPMEWTDMGGEINAAFLTYVGVPKASRVPNLAILTSLFILTPEGQAIFFKHSDRDSHIRGGEMSKYIAKRKAAGKTLLLETADVIRDNPEIYGAQNARYRKLLNR
jgi:ABC-type Fe3+ transport system substrate-binding protein